MPMFHRALKAWDPVYFEEWKNRYWWRRIFYADVKDIYCRFFPRNKIQ